MGKVISWFQVLIFERNLNMMMFNKQKFIIAIICVSLGWGVGYQMGKSQGRKEMQKQMHQMSNDPFGISHFFFSSPWGSFDSETENQEQNEKDTSIWDSIMHFGKKHSGHSEDKGSSLWQPSSGPEFHTREDDKNIYYEFSMENLSKDSMSVRVENNMIVLEGTENKKSFGANISSSFYKSFPAPENVDISKVQMDYENNKLIVKFPKLSTH